MKQKLFITCALLSCFFLSAMAQKNAFANGLYWELNNGVLTISGNGYIPDYTHPWEGKGNVEKIIIQDGVTSIGRTSFWEYHKPNHLKSVVIGNSVTYIGVHAFSCCKLLESVVLGNSVARIDEYAFSECSSLRSISIPSSVKTIHYDAFYGSNNLTITRPVVGPNNAEYSIIIEKKTDKCGLKNSSGNWVIPLGAYKWIEPFTGSYLRTMDGGKYGLITFSGTEIVAPEVDSLEQAGKGYLRFKVNGFWGIMNYQGKIIIPTDRGYTKIGNYVNLTKRFSYEMDGYKGECNQLGQQVSKIKVGNSQQGSSSKTSSNTSSSSSTSSSSNSSSKSSNNSGSKKSTIVVEHHRDPVPVQVWKQCTICFGSGKCQTCGGTGIFTGWSGNSSICEYGCGGSGKCSFCAGHGGHYEVEYR